MKKYEKVEIKFIFPESKDVLTISGNDTVDDLGGWNKKWFLQEDN